LKLRLGAAVLLAALTSLTAVTAPSATAGPGVDITPPEVGSCHDLTFDEGYDAADPDPAVACTEHHTSVTTKVITFADAPDWNDEDAILKVVRRQCTKADLEFFSNNVKAFELSTYGSWFFRPTRVQQEAGANWIRCDIALYGYRSLKPLPTDGDPKLGRLPLDDDVALCRKGKRDDYNVASCDRTHRYHATHAVKYPSSTYPGDNRMTRWTIRKCAEKLGRSFGYWERATRAGWKVGLRYSVCFKTTTG